MAYFEQTKVTDPIGNVINPATEESIILLRRMVKLLESQNATDIANRQRMTLDSIAAGLTLGTVTTVTGVTTVGAVTSITNALPAGTNNIGFINGQDQRQFIDIARNTYANSIRNKLTFS
jgi:hypothetical protein